MLSFLLLVACYRVEPASEEVSSNPPNEVDIRSDVMEQPPVDVFRLVVPAERSPEHAAAVCNNGDRASLSLRRTDSSTWVIRVDGGYFCDDDRTPCAGRARRLTSGRRVSDGLLGDGDVVSVPSVGLFSRSQGKNPLFHGANHAAFHYCSSDLWLGASTQRQDTSGADEGWWFSGRQIFESDLRALVELGMDPANPDTQILVVGHSAGGMGVIGNLSTLRTVLGPAIADGRVKVVLDGAWVPPQPLESTPRANRWGPLEEDCEGRVTESGGDPLSCVFGPEWYPHWKDSGLPVLVQQSGLDTTQLKAYSVPRDELPVWQRGALESLGSVDWLFSGGHRYHTLTFQERLAVGPPDGLFSDLLRDFWQGEDPRRVVFRYAEPRQE